MTTATKIETPATDKITSGVYRTIENVTSKWSNLTFTENGKARLASTAGWIYGISLYDQAAAEKIAADLCKQFDYLNSYGGRREDQRGVTTFSYPAFQIAIGDDGGHGSFAVNWYSATVGYEFVRNRAAGIDHEANASTLDSVEMRHRWERALEAARQQLGVNEKLTITRGYHYEVREGEKPTWYSEQIYYCFRFNGGLILHESDKVSECHWSIHT